MSDIKVSKEVRDTILGKKGGIDAILYIKVSARFIIYKRKFGDVTLKVLSDNKYKLPKGDYRLMTRDIDAKRFTVNLELKSIYPEVVKVRGGDAIDVNLQTHTYLPRRVNLPILMAFNTIKQGGIKLSNTTLEKYNNSLYLWEDRVHGLNGSTAVCSKVNLQKILKHLGVSELRIDINFFKLLPELMSNWEDTRWAVSEGSIIFRSDTVVMEMLRIKQKWGFDFKWGKSSQESIPIKVKELRHMMKVVHQLTGREIEQRDTVRIFSKNSKIMFVFFKGNFLKGNEAIYAHTVKTKVSRKELKRIFGKKGDSSLQFASTIYLENGIEYLTSCGCKKTDMYYNVETLDDTPTAFISSKAKFFMMHRNTPESKE